ncbi:MAG: TolC family protein [Ignavibacteria bacterium]|nr:TolC family protein [Ignavibacteria bacterium]
MKSKTAILIASIFVCLIINFNAFSQSNVESVIKEISGNNKSLIANAQLLQSKKLESKVGISLYNPFIEITNLFGASDNKGDQTEFKVIQAFDFPTSYSKRNKLSDLKMQQTNFEREIFRQNVLLEAKLICMELIYLNKKKLILTRRSVIIENLFNLYQTKLEKGEGNILDVNKAKINLLNIKTELLVLENEINELNQRLIELNGGKSIIFNDTLYPVTPPIPEFATLENTIEESDPLRKSLLQEKLINQGQIDLSKSLSLPKFEIGYYYLGLSNQNFNGIHLGFSIPLWENNYRTDFYKSRVLYSNLEIESHKTEHYYEIKQQYDKYETLRNALNEYLTVLESLKSEELLINALNVGEISILEYFIEVNYYNLSYDKFLELEKEYNKVVAELFKYQL